MFPGLGAKVARNSEGGPAWTSSLRYASRKLASPQFLGNAHPIFVKSAGQFLIHASSSMAGIELTWHRRGPEPPWAELSRRTRLACMCASAERLPGTPTYCKQGVRGPWGRTHSKVPTLSHRGYLRLVAQKKVLRGTGYVLRKRFSG